VIDSTETCFSEEHLPVVRLNSNARRHQASRANCKHTKCRMRDRSISHKGISDTTCLKPWKVKGSRYLVRERFLTARVDDCVTPADMEVPYCVLEYPAWVNIVPLDKEDHLKFPGDCRSRRSRLSFRAWKRSCPASKIRCPPIDLPANQYERTRYAVVQCSRAEANRRVSSRGRSTGQHDLAGTGRWSFSLCRPFRDRAGPLGRGVRRPGNSLCDYRVLLVFPS
jgi:hypothetical protein